MIEGALSRRTNTFNLQIPLRLTNITLDISWLLVAPTLIWGIATIYIPIIGPGLAGFQAWIIAPITLICILICLAVHALAHALVARALGCDAPARLPIHLLGDIAQLWPTAPSAKIEALVSAAGPLAQGFLALMAYEIWNAQFNQFINVISFFLIFFNLGLIAFNLTPAFPFDGSRLVRAFVWRLFGGPGAVTRLLFGLGFIISLAIIGWGGFLVTRHTHLSLETGEATFALGTLILISLLAHRKLIINRVDQSYRLRLPSLAVRTSVSIVLIVVLAAVTFSLLPMNYGLEAPGFTSSVEPMVQLPQQYRHASKGTFIISSVILQAPILTGEWVYGHLDTSIKLVPQEKIFPVTTTTQAVAQTSYQMLLDSETTAVIVGLRLAGYTVEVVGNDAKMPFPIEIVHQKTDGGPSAGLMFTLGVYNLVSPEDLTGGRKIAGTGTVDLEGRVGPIGGVQQKVVAAERAGAQYFLCPSWNYQDAQAYAKRMKVIKVDTIQEAIDFLRGLPPIPAS